MISDPHLIRYACAAHLSGGVASTSPTPTILAEYTSSSSESSLHDLAHECLIRTPIHHSIFSHTIQNLAYTFLIDDPFVFFSISAENLPKPDRILFLNRLKDAAQLMISKHSKSKSKSSKRIDCFAPLCFQSQIQPVFHQLMATANGETVPVKAQSKRVFAVPLLGKVGEGLKKKKRLMIGDSGSESKEILVEEKVELSDQGEATSREIVSDNNSSVCLGDQAVIGAKSKARRIWRRHVWIVLVLDLAVCLVLLGVWLVVCQGLQCIG